MNPEIIATIDTLIKYADRKNGQRDLLTHLKEMVIKEEQKVSNDERITTSVTSAPPPYGTTEYISMDELFGILKDSVKSNKKNHDKQGKIKSVER